MMKKFLLIISIFVLPVLFIQLVSCSKTPTSPIITVGGSSNTATFTPTPSGPTATFTPTSLGGFTNTPTPTPTGVAAPTRLNSYGTSAFANGLYYDGTYIYAAEGQPNVTMFEKWTFSGGAFSPAPLPGGGFSQTRGNLFVTGYPTPQPMFPTPGITPAWSGTTIVANYPMGYAESGGYYGMLDSTTGGAATLWTGCQTLDLPLLPIGTSQYPGFIDGYDGIAFSSPRGLAGDSQGNFYVADTGNKMIEEFVGNCPSGPPPVASWEHYWDGHSSSKPFVDPVAVAVDSSNNVFVADAGYSPSMVEKWSSGGTTILGMWSLVSGCKVNGLAVDNNGDFYVSDIQNSTNGQIEEYEINSSTSSTLLRSWGDTQEPNGQFQPSGLLLIMTGSVLDYVVVSDTSANNPMLVVFQGP
jgi:hypothetical protein